MLRARGRKTEKKNCDKSCSNKDLICRNVKYRQEEKKTRLLDSKIWPSYLDRVKESLAPLPTNTGPEFSPSVKIQRKTDDYVTFSREIWLDLHKTRYRDAL